MFSQAADYVRWDSAYASEDTKLHNSSGTEIKTDWGNITADPDETADFGTFVLEPKAYVTGRGTSVAHGVSGAVDANAYKAILLSLKIQGTFGTSTKKIELNLKNFLSIHSL